MRIAGKQCLALVLVSGSNMLGGGTQLQANLILGFHVILQQISSRLYQLEDKAYKQGLGMALETRRIDKAGRAGSLV